MHANVGGGYPDDGLAFAALDWMMTEARAEGLRYINWIRDEVAARANPQGEQYDSRSGVAGYYRYGPRKVADLCADRDHNVDVPTVRVHPAAHTRIVARERNYAPVSLGGSFAVPGTQVQPSDDAAMENAWDMVWWRRLAYFTTLALTAFVGLFALRLVFDWPDHVLAFTEGWLRWLWSFVTAAPRRNRNGVDHRRLERLLDQIGSVLPSWAGPTIPSFRVYPLSGIVSLLLLRLGVLHMVGEDAAGHHGACRMGLGRCQGSRPGGEADDGLAQQRRAQTSAGHRLPLPLGLAAGGGLAARDCSWRCGAGAVLAVLDIPRVQAPAVDEMRVRLIVKGARSATEVADLSILVGRPLASQRPLTLSGHCAMPYNCTSRLQRSCRTRKRGRRPGRSG